MAHADTKLAEELEADTYPDERSEILLAAADAWQRAGHSDRARAILDDLIRSGREYGCDARIQLADLHLRAGDTEMAYAELNAAAKDPALGERQCELAAELLAANGDLDQAARWYDRGAARLTEGQLDALRRRDQLLTIGTTIMLRNRQHVRQQFGRSPDLLDTLVPELQDPEEPTTSEDVLYLMSSGYIPRQTRMLTFQRDQRRLAQQQWPGVYEQPEDEYYDAAEHRWREVHDGGVPSITVALQHLLAPSPTFALTLSDRYGRADHFGTYCVLDDRISVEKPTQGGRNVGLHGIAFSSTNLIVAVGDKCCLGDPIECRPAQGGRIGDLDQHFSGNHEPAPGFVHDGSIGRG
ncbi:hypothetical protein [Actinoplanes sp. NPDC089786]|uniref:tetratricopeptide repeat protein n=1 Tax=Actinoplanes sp. NPDC089786 TaxID=3155185 RepID=UPI00342A69F5